jgi:hypothetical protein
MPAPDDVTTFAYYVVCVIDVLGQRQKLAGWATLPPDGQITPELLKAIKHTVGTLIVLREQYLDFFMQFDKAPSDPRLASLPQEALALAARFKECGVRVERWSDTFVFSSRIVNTHHDVSITPLYRILASCCMALRIAIASETPIRGAISIGSGAYLEDGGFYGPALAEAAHFESHVAGYPRIIVAPSVIEFLKHNQGYSKDPRLQTLMGQLADTCRSFICQDTDSNLIVDFLGQGCRTMFGPDEAQDPPSVKPAYEFVRSQYLHFQKVGNSELAGRYMRLLKYCQSRLPIWGLTPGA